MQNKLQVLIDYYEEERQTITQSLEESVQEKDYFKAHQLSKALNYIKGKLDILQNLAINSYDKITSLENEIVALEKEIVAGLTGIKSYILPDLLVRKQEHLQKLNAAYQQTSTNHFVFNETLDKLITKKIKYFNLVLNKQKGFYFEFKIIKKEFRVTIPNIKTLSINFYFFGSQIKAYQRLGFKLKNNGNKMVLELPCKTEEDIIQLKIIISRAVFEIYGSGLLGTYIEYKEIS